MEASYTKGEWTIEDSIIQENKHIKIKSDKVNTIVCNKMVIAFCGTNGSKEGIANAKLIAAAPEMLEVLETIENDANQIPEWLWLRIKNAIKKATE